MSLTAADLDTLERQCLEDPYEWYPPRLVLPLIDRIRELEASRDEFRNATGALATRVTELEKGLEHFYRLGFGLQCRSEMEAAGLPKSVVDFCFEIRRRVYADLGRDVSDAGHHSQSKPVSGSNASMAASSVSAPEGEETSSAPRSDGAGREPSGLTCEDVGCPCVAEINGSSLEVFAPPCPKCGTIMCNVDSDPRYRDLESSWWCPKCEPIDNEDGLGTPSPSGDKK